MAVNDEISVGPMNRERKNALVRQYMQNKRLKDQIDKLEKENIEYARVFNHQKDTISDLQEDLVNLDV